MSPMTILATLAFATPTNESGPVWSAITPTLMLSVMDSSFAGRAADRVNARSRHLRCGTMLAPHRVPYIGRSPHHGCTAPPRRVRGDARARAGQRLRPAARVAAAIVPPRRLDV